MCKGDAISFSKLLFSAQPASNAVQNIWKRHQASDLLLEETFT